MSYIEFLGNAAPWFRTVTTVTVTNSQFFQSSILYQALQRPQQFVGHAAGIAVYAEDWSYVYRSGVRTVGVVAAPDLCFPYVSEYYVHSNFFCLKRNQIAIYLLPL